MLLQVKNQSVLAVELSRLPTIGGAQWAARSLGSCRPHEALTKLVHGASAPSGVTKCREQRLVPVEQAEALNGSP